jgi:glutamate synthase (NADPH) large chain
VLKQLLENHVAHTGSPKAKAILADWPACLRKFVKVFPHEYRRVLTERAARAAQSGLREAVRV